MSIAVDNRIWIVVALLASYEMLQVFSSGGIVDDERLLYSEGSWHRAQRKRIPFETACYYTHESELPYGCQYDVSKTSNWMNNHLGEKTRLMEFYQALDGPNWRTSDNWGVGDPCWDAWYGITCDEHGKVISIELVDNSLVGEIPVSFSDFTSLLKFDLSTSARHFHHHANLYINRVKGTIPSLIKMSRLEEIAVASNEIAGLPPDLYLNGDTLRLICASDNNLTEIPNYLNYFKRLHTLELDSNRIEGPIPPDLGYLLEARHIQLQFNQFSGNIPETIKQMTRILNFDVSHNTALTGVMGEDIIVDWAEVEYIAILNTSLRGYIPSLCLDVPYCWRFMFDTHKDLTWVQEHEIPDLVNVTLQLAHSNPASYDSNGKLVR